MEAVLARTAASRHPSRIHIAARDVWLWVLCAGLVLYLGLEGGGYDPVVRSNAGIVVWWIILVGAVCGVLPAARPSRVAWAAIGLLFGFLVWSAIAAGWSLSSEDTLQEVSRVAAYTGVLVLAVLSFGDRRRAMKHVVSAVAAAIVVLVALALLARLRPGLFAGATVTSSLLPGTQGRLSWPLNYWNAMAALVALCVPLLMAVAGSARSLLAQAAAAAALPMIALCGYLTFSRGGAIAVAVAVAAYIVLAPDRLAKLATLLAGAAGSAALIAGAVHRHAVEQGVGGPVARHQGATLIVAVILVCAGVGLMQIGIGLAARHGTAPRLLRPSPARARGLVAIAVVVAIGLGVAVHLPGRIDHAWQEFKRPQAANLHQNALGRYGALSGNGRYTYWKVALHATSGDALRGSGPGTFQLVWLPRAPFPSYVRDAHSLYVQTLTETGIVGLLLLVGCFVAIVACGLYRVLRDRVEDRARAAALTASALAFLTSAAFDWVWQVPVLPVTFLILAAALLAPARALQPPGRRVEDAERRDDSTTRGVWKRWGGRTVVALVALACLIAIGVPLTATEALNQSQAAVAVHNNSAALAYAETALRVEPGAASAALQQALVLEQQRRFGPAVLASRRATGDEPANWGLWLVRSRLEAEANHPAQAVAAFRRAHALNPQSGVF